ncbi:hypothetical protein E2562_030753 [Oryza meyeriana var. granulata]|uniref:Uncharacterized protein n=1 Tax=Oryza meyeriana var. granulata TaxID=110450 RepID=A0A6G1E4D6_9ORYZ|nr:hypothetical protein E2562_030753 [Oryza meyeriana var. granulata]
MAARVLLRAAALGLTAAAAGSLYAVATWKTPELVSPVTPSLRHCLLDSAQGLQSALLRGVHLRDVRARAKLDLKRVDAAGPGGDPAAATDLRLLLALLAARDGRAAEAARDSPFDPRPRVPPLRDVRSLGAARRWYAAYCRLVPEEEILDPNFPGFVSDELTRLINELVVAASATTTVRLQGSS